MTTKAESFRALHERTKPFIIPNPWDVGSAHLLAAMGFEALATTSAGMAFALGLTDGGVPLRGVLDHCRDIVAATPLPVTADLEKGFGDSPGSVAQTIRVAAEAGLAGCSIEDSTGRTDDPIFEKSLAIERIAAACEASRSLPGDFVLTARSENYAMGRPDLDDTIERLQAFADAGADVLYAPALHDLETIRTICAAVDKPVNVVMDTPGSTFSLGELADAGVKRISVGSALAQLAYGSLVTAARDMQKNGSFSFADEAMDYTELHDLFTAGKAT